MLKLDVAMNTLSNTRTGKSTTGKAAMGKLSIVPTIVISSLSLISFATVVTLPGFAPHDNGAAMAQSGDEFERYVRAAFEIEKERRGMMGQVKTITGGNVPGNVCRNLGQIGDEGQRNQVKDICGKFAAFAAGAIKRHSLTPKQFNSHQSQAAGLRQQINETIQKLQLK
jgi:hypothetical protein